MFVSFSGLINIVFFVCLFFCIIGPFLCLHSGMDSSSRPTESVIVTPGLVLSADEAFG